MHLTHILRRGNHVVMWAAALALLVSLIIPAVAPSRVNGAQITARSVTIDKSNVNATDVEWAFAYNLPTAGGEFEGIRYQFCDNPLGTCTVPSGMDVGADTVTSDAQSGWPENTTNWALATADENACQETTDSTFELCFERTTTAATGGGAVTHTISGITAPDTNDTVYVRILTYAVDDFTSFVDDGVVAAAFVNQLTLTATVQENLVFCVGDTDADSAHDCSDITGSTVDLDILDFTQVNESSVDGAVNDRNGYVMMRTNAASGLNVDYYGGDATGALVSGANTIGPNSDAEGAVGVGVSEWGMDITSLDTSNGSTTNLTLDTNFNDATNNTTYWGATDTTADDLVDSVTAVDDEMLILDFEASTTLTQLPGVYSTTITFVATPTF